jgi:hypothetical protein
VRIRKGGSYATAAKEEKKAPKKAVQQDQEEGLP